MATQNHHGATGAVKVRVISAATHRDPLQIDGEILRLQGLVTAYRRNLKLTRTGHQRLVLQKALQRVRAELRLIHRNSRRPEAA